MGMMKVEVLYFSNGEQAGALINYLAQKLLAEPVHFTGPHQDTTLQCNTEVRVNGNALGWTCDRPREECLEEIKGMLDRLTEGEGS